MAKLFNPSVLPAADQAAYNNWKAKAQQYLQGGALPAELSYALAHPEYVQQRPELKDAYDTLTGANLPPTVKAAVQSQVGDNVNFDWRGGEPGIARHGGVWSQPETWIQLALAGTVGGAAASGAFAGGGGASGGATAAAGGGLEEATGVVAPSIAGTSTGATTAAGTGMAAPAGTGLSTNLANAGKMGLINKYVNKYGPLVGAAGSAIGAATQAAASNRRDEDLYGIKTAELNLENNRLGLEGYQANTSAQNAYQNQLQNLAVLEAAQRKTGLSNIYKQSVVQNPSKSPYNTGSLPGVSNAYKAALDAVASQAGTQLATPPKYDAATGIPTPTYNPYQQPPFTPPTQTPIGKMENVGNWLTPVLAGIGGYYTYLNPPPPAKK
jgi:hypothetical protein